MSWERIFQDLQSESEKVVFAAVKEAREKVSGKNPPVGDLVDAGIVPVLVRLLDHSSALILQEVIWILINVAFGTSDQAYSIIQSGGVPKLVNLVKSSDFKVANQSVWVLSNLCGDGPLFRNLLIDEGVINVLKELLERPGNSLEFMQSVVWLSLNLSRHTRVPLSRLQPLFQPLLNIISEHEDEKILVDTIWFFTNLVNFNGTISDTLLFSFLSRTRPLLSSTEVNVVEAVLRLVSAVLMSRFSLCAEQVVRAGMVPQVVTLVLHEKVIISRLSALCCRYLANFSSHCRYLVENDIFSVLIQLFNEEKFSWRSKREGIWLIKNIILRGMPDQKVELSRNNQLLSALFNLLENKENEIVKSLLQLLFSLKDLPYQTRLIDYNQFKDRMTDCGLFEKLENLMDHVDEEIHTQTLTCLESIYAERINYFPEEFGSPEE